MAGGVGAGVSAGAGASAGVRAGSEVASTEVAGTEVVGAAGAGVERRLADAARPADPESPAGLVPPGNPASGRPAGSGRLADAVRSADAAHPAGLVPPATPASGRPAGSGRLADAVRSADAAHPAGQVPPATPASGRPAGSGCLTDPARLADPARPTDPAGSAAPASAPHRTPATTHLLGVGVALPGPLDHAHGILHRVTGFPEWDGFPLRDALARRLGVPVVVDKDTNAAALGLAVGGEGGAFAYLHLGTGLGAGLVIGGGVHRGARTGAGEFGHQVIQLDGPPCDCGNRGCIEALCLAAVARGDVDEAARVLGAGAANLVGLLDIDLVLLGGRTVAADPEPFVRGVAAVLGERARREGAREAAVPVRVAPGGARGVAEGAAQLLLGPLFGRADG
ncbi:ROK family protein [Streptomyces sp. NBC_00986]|uniref:ROK family protein n=1 Tax=Streptomyces sp. NBC_00986 TaxID=2903702 RepID=UPI0038674198